MESNDYPMQTPKPGMSSTELLLARHILFLIACTLGQSRAVMVQHKGSEVRTWTLSKLKVSDNGRHFVREDGSAFIWIGDTSWHIHAMTTEEMDEYISTRKAQDSRVRMLNARKCLNGTWLLNIR